MGAKVLDGQHGRIVRTALDEKSGPMKCVNVNTWTFQWEHCGKIYDGKSWENNYKYTEKWEILYKWNVIVGKIIENQTGNTMFNTLKSIYVLGISILNLLI